MLFFGNCLPKTWKMWTYFFGNISNWIALQWNIERTALEITFETRRVFIHMLTYFATSFMFCYLLEAKCSRSLICEQYFIYIGAMTPFCHETVYERARIFAFSLALSLWKIDLKHSGCGYISSNASFQIFRSHVNGMNSIMMWQGAKQT